jgi:hypothetical protein
MINIDEYLKEALADAMKATVRLRRKEGDYAKWGVKSFDLYLEEE